MSKPRIYIAISTFLPAIGGAEMQALTQGRCLREQGYEATVITLRHDRAWRRREVIEGVPVIRVAGSVLSGREKLPAPFRKLAYATGLLMMAWTLWRLRRQYDLVHVYQCNLLVVPTAVACRLTGTPLIVGLRSAAQGGAAKRNKATLLAGPLDASAPWLQVSRPPRLPGDLAQIERLGKPAIWFTRTLLQQTGAQVVVLSTHMYDYLSAHNFRMPGVRLIPNGVDMRRFTCVAADNASDGRSQVVVCVSRLKYDKGIDVLLQAWRLVHERAPGARLIVVGTGPLRAQLELMAQALGIQDSVEFAGLQTDVPAQLRRGGLAVQPSRWEGMPNALLEAMACGLACVATRVSGSEDVLQHGVDGVLVEPEDYEGMAEALLTLLHDPGLAQRYAQAGQVKIERQYSLDCVAAMYAQLYDQVAAGTRQISGQQCSNPAQHASHQ